MKKRLGLKVLAISIILTVVASGIVFGASPKSSEKVQDETIIFDTGKGGPPSIYRTHIRNFTPEKPMNISKEGNPPTDIDGDGLYEDINGDGKLDWYDLVTFTHYFSAIKDRPDLHKYFNFYLDTKFDANDWYALAWMIWDKDSAPPSEVSNLRAKEIGNEYINITWGNPSEIDFNGLKIHLNGSLVEDLPKNKSFCNITNLNPGTEYSILVKGYDWKGNLNEGEEIKAKTLKNKPPIAIFNYNPKNLKVNQTIFFNASDSFDPDGKIEQYLWDFNNDSIIDAYGKTANHSYSSAGIKEAILKVIDNQGAENQTSKEINISPNQIPLVNLDGPYSGEVDKPVYFDAYATDPDGNITKYTLYFGDGSNITRIISPPQKQVNITELHNYTAADLYNAILRATDDNYEPGTHQTQVNITEPQGNKIWAEMDFGERKALVEEFLERDPTDYDAIHQCIYIADALHKNATNAKALYGLEDDIPMCLNHCIENEHVMNAVLLGVNKSNIEHFGFISGKDHLYIIDKNVTLPFEADRTDRIWKNGSWIVPDELYRLEDYKVGFNVSWLPHQKPTIEIIPEYPSEYQDLYPA